MAELDAALSASVILAEAAAGRPVALAGRATVLDTALDLATDDSGPRLLVLGGASGIGRSAVLDEFAQRCAGAGVRVLRQQVVPQDRDTPLGVVYRLLTELTRPDDPRLAELVALLAAPGPDLPRLAAVLAGVLRGAAPVTLLIDDAHLVDTASLALLEELLTRLAGTRCLLVATADLSGPAGQGAGLPDGEQVRWLLLRPLREAESGAVLATLLQAQPDASLVHELHRAAAGNPRALVSGVDDYLRAGRLRVVDRHAYLVPGGSEPAQADSHPLLVPLAGLGADVLGVASALAVLAPLGAAAAGLAAEGTGLSEAEVHAALDTLTRSGVLVPGSAPRRPRFRVPLVRAALAGRLGPYQRRHLAALAVNAIWAGTATPEAEDFLPDRLAEAGTLVDPARASGELLAHGGAAFVEDGHRAARWLAAALRLISDPTQLATTLLLHAAACAIHGRLDEAMLSARRLVREYSAELPASTLMEMMMIYLSTMWAVGEKGELARIAERDWAELPADRGTRLVCRGAALCLLERYSEGRAVLTHYRDEWLDQPMVADFGHIFLGSVEMLQGDPARFEQFLADRTLYRVRELPQHRFEQNRNEVAMLLARSDLARAEKLLAEESITADQLYGSSRFLIAQLSGQWGRAMEIARSTIAAGHSMARQPMPTLMFAGAADILMARGRLVRARSMLEAGQDGHCAHLLDVVHARVLRTLGDLDAACALLRSAAEWARELGYVLGTAQLWAELANTELRRGNQEAAEQAAARLSALPVNEGDQRRELLGLLTTARVHGDRDAAVRAVRLARQRAMPFESALTFMFAAEAGVEPDVLLPEAYQIFGTLDALLYRSWVRDRMRATGVPVPGRAATTAENDRLLAVLVTEGLSNRQLATVLDISEKSVEGKLTRMFARSGYRSRVDLVSAKLTGEYRG